MRVRVLFVLAVVFLKLSIFAQESAIEWFPKSTAFPLLKYDLLETQFYTGAMFLTAEKDDYEGAFIPVNIGIQKPFFGWDIGAMQFQFALGAASYTQFEIIRYDENTLQGGLLNNDYKASAYILAKKKVYSFRLQLFHISSHLGDDYMLRNEYYELNDKSVNYEQLDLTFVLSPNKLDYYTGIGVVVSPNTFRERWMFQLGVQGSTSISASINFAFGCDVKIYQEHSFKPDNHLALGFEFIKNNKPQLNLSIDTYYGAMPYSTLKLGAVFWIGPSAIVYI